MTTASPLLLTAQALADLRQGGVLSQRLPGYEERPAQLDMTELVIRALGAEVPLLCEAGTGTGKSLSYLIPIVRSGKRAIISTANKALQEQLFYKDIPFVQQHVQPFEAALVKGVGNYVCLDRLDEEQHGLQFYVQDPVFNRLLDAVADDMFSGDFESLGFPLPAEVRSRVCGDSDRCAWSKCSYFADCYIRKMRERAERAQVIVINHTLLLLDAAAGGAILPDCDIIVIDEAHHLEEEATRAFTVAAKASQVFTLLAQKTLQAQTPLKLQQDAASCAALVWERLEALFPANTAVNRVPLAAPLEEGLQLATLVENLALALRQQPPLFSTEREEVLYNKLVTRAEHLASSLRLVFAVDAAARYVYYLERSLSGNRQPIIEVAAAPLDISHWLKEKLFEPNPTVIMTSATLATVGQNPARPEEHGPNFAFFRKRIGLDPIERPDVLERILPLTFDYATHALLYIPRDLPEPAYGSGEAAQAYTLAVARRMYLLVQASRGRAFLLFSSRRMLDQAYDLMAPHLEYPLLRQGDMTRIELTRRFREEEGAILFGLKSFWEGVDIAGEALSLVVIDKLPFEPPDDPVQEARVARLKAVGENWFGAYVLPQAVLRLKQGVGRLLRTHEDRGVMALLDARLHTRGYGKQVLNALPPAHRTDRLKEVQTFFGSEVTRDSHP